MALVSVDLPLRANLSVLENVAIVPQYARAFDEAGAAAAAYELLERLGQTACAGLRDHDLSHEERFAAKLARAVIAARPEVLIERPAYLLPDTNYPRHIASALAALGERLPRCTIIDYTWNAPLYPRQ